MTEDNQIKKRKISDNIFILFLLTYVLTVLGQLVGALAVVGVSKIIGMQDTDIWLTARIYLAFLGVWLIMLLFLYIFKRNRPILQKLTHKRKHNNVPFLLLGLLIGFVLNGTCVLVAWLNKDIALYFDHFNILGALFLFVAIFIQSSAEEMVTRGFLYERLRWGYKNPWVAIIGNAALFMLLHVLNPGFTVWSVVNIFLSGLQMALMVYYFDSLWCAMAIHTAWNYTQNILFGLPNSGMVFPYSIFKLDAASAQNSFAYDVGFGIEGTLVSCIVLGLACVLTWFFGEKYKKSKALTEENQD